jgi:hypothetical protein
VVGGVVGAGADVVAVTSGSATRSPAGLFGGLPPADAAIAMARPEPETTAAISSRKTALRPGSGRRWERIIRSSNRSAAPSASYMGTVSASARKADQAAFSSGWPDQVASSSESSDHAGAGARCDGQAASSSDCQAGSPPYGRITGSS